MDMISSMDRRNPLEKMNAAGLAHLPFSEYSEAYPHVQYTVGYRVDSTNINRPGPSFFINKLDNTSENSGSPCFGRILIGQDIVERIGQIEAKPDDTHFSQRVRIVSATILTSSSSCTVVIVIVAVVVVVVIVVED